MNEGVRMFPDVSWCASLTQIGVFIADVSSTHRHSAQCVTETHERPTLQNYRADFWLALWMLFAAASARWMSADARLQLPREETDKRGEPVEAAGRAAVHCDNDIWGGIVLQSC